MLSGVSAICLAGKFLGGAVTDKLGGWIVLVAVFVAFVASSAVLIGSTSAQVFGAMWWVNSLAYTITWGAACQVIGVSYSEADRPAQLTKIASASRFGASLGSMLFGTLLKSGMHWRKALLPALPAQALVALACLYSWSSSKAASAAPGAGRTLRSSSKGTPKATPAAAGGAASGWDHFKTLDLWLMLIPKVLIFTYTVSRSPRPSRHAPGLRAAPPHPRPLLGRSNSL